MTAVAAPPIVSKDAWESEIAALRTREKAATRERDAIAAARRRLPMVEVEDYTIQSRDGPIKFSDVFDGCSQLIVYSHMWEDGQEYQCNGCTGMIMSLTPAVESIRSRDARFVVFVKGPIEEGIAYAKKMGYMVPIYSSHGSTYEKDVGCPQGGFIWNVFFKHQGKVYRTWYTMGRGSETFHYIHGMLDVLPYGRKEEWQDVPKGWPQGKTYEGWKSSEELAHEVAKARKAQRAELIGEA